jgi:ubiquinone/menaquinone biosynthesis C-methylase UbiE
MTDLGEIGEFDTIYCSHALEHLTAAGALKALREFYRVLKPGGKVMIFVPDTEGVSPTDEVLFISPSGPITGMTYFTVLPGS